MSFETYKKKADEKWQKLRQSHQEPMAQQERDRFYQLYASYTNKQLVWATWFLAIATIILSILTILLK
jgi:CHASE3 domain sensor protein